MRRDGIFSIAEFNDPEGGHPARHAKAISLENEKSTVTSARICGRYQARQKSLNRLVAIKILAPEREHDARFAARFAREAELLANGSLTTEQQLNSKIPCHRSRS
jgi:hypothetical protein